MLKKILVFCSKNKFFWIKEAADIYILRHQFRITGNLVKVSIFNSKLNFFLFLSLEEVIIGLEIGFLKLKISIKPKNHLIRFLLKSFQENLFFYQKFDQQKVVKNFRFLRKRNCIIKNWRELVDIVSKICVFELKKKIKPLKKICFFVQTLTYNTIKIKSIFLRNFIENFTESEFLRYSVFKNFWQKGFTLTCGIKFGSTFLGYAGDITSVHSYLSILTFLPRYSNLSTKLLIAFGRVGTITKKFNILVNLDKCCSITFISLRWHNFLP